MAGPMTDELKTSVLSVAQFRAQLERYKYGCATTRKKVLEQLISSYAEARQASAWQPIEERPRDGRALILAFGHRRHRKVGFGTESGMDDLGGRFFNCFGGDEFANVTHFQLLPLAPPVLEDDAHER